MAGTERIVAHRSRGAAARARDKAWDEVIDLLAAAVIAITGLRGLLIGLIREAFSLGSIAAAVIAARFLAPILGDWLIRVSDGGVSASAAPWIAGATVAVITIAVIARAGRSIRRGLDDAGYNWADRACGAALGSAEGALLVVILVGLASTFLGRDHQSIDGSQSLYALERLEGMARDRNIDVSAPPIYF